MATKRALLIGIANYPHVASTLKGCINDVRLLRDLLIDRFGFAPDAMTMLIDDQATRAGILSAFDALVTATAPDDIVVIHYAGHGSRMADREGDEPSGFDSTIVPFDATRPPGEIPDITDDEIHLRLESLAAKTAFITLIVDACHSGTITRDEDGERARSIEADRRPVSELPPSPIPLDRRTRWRDEGPRPLGPSGWLPPPDRYVLIAGCRDDELSYEYRPPEGGASVVHGALTWFLCQRLRLAPPGASYRDVFEQAAALVTSVHVLQHPQMEGCADRELFGLTDAATAAFVPILEREGDVVLLAAGAAHGLVVGETYRVFPHGTRRDDVGGSVGEVAITAIQSVTAMARITREERADAIEPDARAFAVERIDPAERYRRALAIDNPDPRSRLRGRFSLELQAFSRDTKTWSVARPAADRGLIEFDDGQIVRVVIRSQHDRPVFISLVDFGLGDAITPIYPAAGAQEMLRAQGELACPAQQLGFPAGDDAADGVETVKLFVTEQAAAFTTTRRDDDEGPAEDEDWTTVSVPFVLRRLAAQRSST